MRTCVAFLKLLNAFLPASACVGRTTLLSNALSEYITYCRCIDYARIRRGSASSEKLIFIIKIYNIMFTTILERCFE